MNRPPLESLQDVLGALGPIADGLVFIGGATLSLYFQDPPSEAPRVTDDVDCVTEALSLPDFYRFEERLRQAGFKSCQEEGAPLCRWWVAGHRVDFMPQEGGVLGFGNPWYGPGCRSAEWSLLPDGKRLKIFSLPWFLAAKMQAHAGRGGSDPRLSQDLEDVLVILGARRDLPELAQGLEAEPRAYLAEAFGRLLSHPGWNETLNSALEHRRPAPHRVKRVLEFLRALVPASDPERP